MNRKSKKKKKNTQINEIKPISGTLLPSAKNIANYLDKHFFSGIGERIALRSPAPPDGISFEARKFRQQEHGNY